MRVGIVELAFHNEVLRSYINILKDIADEITCFTNTFCFDQLYDYQQDAKLNWELKKGEKNETYFKKQEKNLSDCDVVIIITLDDDLDFFSNYKWPTKSILLVHDYYAFFEPKQINYAGTIIEKARATKSWLQYHSKSEKKKIKSLIDRMDKLAAPSQSVMDFVKQRNPSPKLSEVLDFAIPNKKPEEKGLEKTIITIPGNVIPKSRNYQAVVSAIKEIKDKIYKTELVILGQAKTNYGRKIIHDLEQFQNENLKIKYYQSFIHQKDFDEQLSVTDFLLLPISKVMRYRHFKEMNGFTCVSGNINDMLYFGKPAIIPKFYPLDDIYEPMVKRYNDENNLSNILLDWINNKTYQKKSSKIAQIQEVSRKEILNRFRKAIS